MATTHKPRCFRCGKFRHLMAGPMTDVQGVMRIRSCCLQCWHELTEFEKARKAAGKAKEDDRPPKIVEK